MRVFDREEKEIISKVVNGEGYSRNLVNLIDRYLQGVRIKVDYASCEAFFLFECQNEEPTDNEISWAINRQKELIEVLITHVSLFRYFEKEELAFFFDPATSTDRFVEFGMGMVNRPSFTMQIDDKNIVNLLMTYLRKEIKPSPLLREYERNSYLSDDEIKFNKQHKATWAAIIVSILFGAYGVVSSYQSGLSQEEQYGKQVQENRKLVELLVKGIKETNSLEYVDKQSSDENVEPKFDSVKNISLVQDQVNIKQTDKVTD